MGLGLACSSDQSMPQNTGASPCQRHRMNPQRDCRACQDFMRSRHPEPRGNQFAPRVQQRFPPPMRHQGPPQQPPIGSRPFLQGRSTMSPPVAQHHLNQNRVGPIGPSPQIPGGPSPLEMGVSSPQIMSQTNMGSPLQGLSSAMQPQVIQGSALHIPQQVMPPQVINQEVRTVQTSAQPLCQTSVVLPPTQEILQPHKVVMPLPTVIRAPALPPCPTNMLVQKVRSSPQRPEIRTFAPQATHSRIQPQHQQPRFL